MTIAASADLARFRALDAAWTDLVRPLRLDRGFAPVNLAVERTAFLERWHRGESTEPRFAFEAAAPIDPRPIESFRRQLRPEACDIEAIYDRLAEETLSTIAFLIRRDPADLTAATTRAYGIPGAALLAQARGILQEAPPPPPPPPSIDAESAAARLREGLVAGGYEGWTVLVEPLMNARMSVDSLRNEVKVRAGSMFRPDAISRLLVHEIGVHVHRAHRGSRQPLPLLGRGLPGYLATEEGLAVWHEKRAGLLDPATLRIYAARVLAADAALSLGFTEVFRIVEPFVAAENAFEIAARAKRGLVDPSKPGAHTKDHVYLRGFIEVTDHLVSRSDDLPRLMSAKIGLADLPWLAKLVDRGLASILA